MENEPHLENEMNVTEWDELANGATESSPTDETTETEQPEAQTNEDTVAGEDSAAVIAARGQVRAALRAERAELADRVWASAYPNRRDTSL